MVYKREQDIKTCTIVRVACWNICLLSINRFCFYTFNFLTFKPGNGLTTTNFSFLHNLILDLLFLSSHETMVQRQASNRNNNRMPVNLASILQFKLLGLSISHVHHQQLIFLSADTCACPKCRGSTIVSQPFPSISCRFDSPS